MAARITRTLSRSRNSIRNIERNFPIFERHQRIAALSDTTELTLETQMDESSLKISFLLMVGVAGLGVLVIATVVLVAIFAFGSSKDQKSDGIK